MAADDSQPECALSGEAFETFWDDAAEEWRFRDAVRLSARQAARCAHMPAHVVLGLDYAGVAWALRCTPGVPNVRSIAVSGFHDWPHLRADQTAAKSRLDHPVVFREACMLIYFFGCLINNSHVAVTL